MLCLNTMTSRIKTHVFFDVLELVSNSAGAKGSKKLSGASVPSMMMQRRFHLPFYTVRDQHVLNEKHFHTVNKVSEKFKKRNSMYYSRINVKTENMVVAVKKGESTTRSKTHWRASTAYVKSVFIVHVGGTRCVPWSIDRIIHRHAWITWGVELIRAIFFLFFLYV